MMNGLVNAGIHYAPAILPALDAGLGAGNMDDKKGEKGGALVGALAGMSLADIVTKKTVDHFVSQMQNNPDFIAHQDAVKNARSHMDLGDFSGKRGASTPLNPEANEARKRVGLTEEAYNKSSAKIGRNAMIGTGLARFAFPTLATLASQRIGSAFNSKLQDGIK
jgi:hypothetical protein